jgi:K+-transporting ATPase ATPase A chain
VAIKQLGTNGGGFFNVNSAHPLENPTPLSNFLEMPGDPADSGRAVRTRSAPMTRDKRQGWAHAVRR